MFDRTDPVVAKAYKAWAHMKGRCYCKTDKNYPDYGGRGISVCDRWRNNFALFYTDVSALENFGKKGYSLNRIDNEGNYEPENVEWASHTAQQNNKRSNRLISYNGRTQTLGEWVNELGLDYRVVWTRMYKLHWSAEEAFTNEKYPQYRERGSNLCTR